MSDKSSMTTTALAEQLDRTRLKSDSGIQNSVRSELTVTNENEYADQALVDGYSYEGEVNEGYEYTEDCEEGFEFCKNNKREPYPQRSRSILEEDAFPEVVLTAVEARKCLNRIGQVGTGLQYAFVQIDVDHRDLTNIEEIANFKYLFLVNVSHNCLDSNALDVLRHLEYVVVVHADHNNVNSFCLSPMPYLQVLTLNSNRVSSLSGLKQPSLECLELNDNKISYLTQVPGKNHSKNYCDKEIVCPNLSTLALSRNALDSVEQFVIVSTTLRTLYLSYNKIDNLNGLDNLRNLSRLHLRGNQISNLDGFTDNLKCLSYLNLRENRLSDVKELNKLVCLISLKTLVLSGNSFGQNSIEPTTVRSTVLKLLHWLERVDKKNVSPTEYNSEQSGKNLQSVDGNYEEEEEDEEE